MQALTNRALLEQLLQMNEHELNQFAMLSVEVRRGDELETLFVPVTEVVQITEPLYQTPDGVAPESVLSPEERVSDDNHLWLPAGQLFFTYSLPPDEPAEYPAPAAVPNRE